MRRLRRDPDPGLKRLHLVLRGQPPRPPPPSGPDPPPSRPLTPPNSPRNLANLCHSVVVSPTVVRRFAGGLELATLCRRFVDCRSQVRRSRTCDSPSSRVPATLRRHAYLRLSVVVSPTVVRRFVGGLELATLRRRFGDCRSQVRRSRTCDSPSSSCRLSLAGFPWLDRQIVV